MKSSTQGLSAVELEALKREARVISKETNPALRRKLRAAVPRHKRLHVFTYLDQIYAQRRKGQGDRLLRRTL